MAIVRTWGLSGLAALLLALGTPGPPGQAAPLATPSAEDLLRAMSQELKDAGTFRFHAEIEFDDVLASGQKLQYAGAVDVTVRRPDGVYVDYRDDLSAKRFWYDGKTGTLLTRAAGMYSTVELPDTIDAAVDELQDRYALSLPLADLISSDLFEMLQDRALAWGYVGLHDVGGVLTHHIALVGPNADLQVWIQQDGPPLPLKLVVTYKNAPRAPQYQALLMDWDLSAAIEDDVFEPTLPDGAQRIEFLVPEEPK